jgi:quinohemoprotein ethanol dehydrogenase
MNPVLKYAASLLALGSLAASSAAPIVTTASTGIDTDRLSDEANGDDWGSYGRTYSENHYSPLTQITTGNVARLGLAWSLDLNTPLRADSQPLAANGILYVATGLSVVQAVDAISGRVLWRYDPDVAAVGGRKLRSGWGIRGLALWKDRVIVGTQDGRLIGLNAKTGTLVWSKQTLDKTVDAMGEADITGAPRVFDGKVVIGFGGAERWARGAVSCFDAETGKFLWRFYTVPGDPAKGFENDTMAMAAKTWTGEWWKYGGGGTVWNAMTYDPELKRLYIGTGNGGPWNWRIRNPGQGDNLFLASIVALDAETGKYVWHYQENPNEAWDYNSTMDMEMATLSIEGRQRKVLMHAPKNGFYYVVDRETGKLISAEKIGQVSWAKGVDLKTGRPIENPGIRYENGPILQWPGTYGTHNWQPMSFSPKTGLAYIPTIHQADIYSADGINAASWQPVNDAWNTGMGGAGTLVAPTDSFSSTLQAWDPVAQKARWTVPAPGIVNGGTMATGGGLIFQGHIDGTLNAYDAGTGKLLWHFPAGVSVLGAPISYTAKGRQMVSVVVGPPSGSPSATLTEQAKFGWNYLTHPRMLLTFALGGKAKLPAIVKPAQEKPLTSRDLVPDPKLATAGGAIFNSACMTCHGVGAVASGGAPDLRASPVPLDRDTFAQIVKDGALLKQGMPGFESLKPDELDALRHYIRQQALTPQRSNVHAM